MTRLAFAVSAVVMVGGCTCKPTTPDCTESTVTFERPTAGATVEGAFPVTINVKNPDGTTFDIDAATLSVGSATFTGAITGNVAEFTDVSAPVGMQTLSVSIAKNSCSKTVTSTVNVNSTCSTPTITSLSSASAPNQMANSITWPRGSAFDLKVVGTCTSGLQARVHVTNAAGAVIGTATDFVNGNANFSLTSAGGMPQGDGVVTLFVEMLRAGQVVASLSQQFSVTRAGPASCTIDPLDARGPSGDSNAVTPGYQIIVTGQITDGSGGTLVLNNGTPVTVTPNNGRFVHEFTVTPPTNMESTLPLSLTCTDSNSNTSMAMESVTLDFLPPTIHLDSPANCAASLATFTTTASATVGGAEGQMVSFSSRPASMPTAMPAPIGSASVSNGMASGSITFPSNGSFVLLASVSDAHGNTAQDVVGDVACADGGAGGIVVNSSLCTLNFTRPTMSPATILRPAVVGGNYALSLTSSCMNAPVKLSIDGTLTTTTSTDGAGVVGFNVSAVDGSTFVYRACVANAGANPDTCTSVSVTYRLSQPTIVSPSPSLMPLNSSRDMSDSMAGVQYDLAFTSPPGLATYVCSNQTPAPGNAVACPDGSSGFWVLAGGSSFSSPQMGFTFPDGTYSLIVVSQAAGGQYDTSAPLAVVADGLRPCVAIGLTVLGDTNNDQALNASELAGTVSARFTLGCGDVPANITSVKWTSGCGATLHNQASGVSEAAGVYTVVLQRSTLPTPVEQQYQFGIQVTDNHGNTNVLCGTTPAPNAGALFSLRVDDTPPVCTIAGLSNNAVFGLAGDADSSTAGFQLRTNVDTSTDVVTTAVAVTVTGATSTAGTASRTGDRVTRDFTFPATGTNTVSVGAVCTDAAGNATTGTSRTGILLDRDPPTCTLVTPANNSSSGTFSIATRVDVTGAEGQTVTVRSGATDVGTLTVASGTAQGTLTYGSGMQSITATVSDTAANACTTSANALNVNAVGCSLTITAPTATITALNSTPVSPGVASIQVAATSSNCQAGQVVKLYRVLPGPRTLLSTSATGVGTGLVSFTTNVNDGTTVQYDVEIDNGAGVLNTPTTGSLAVDISPATIGSVSPNLPTIFVVSNTNVNVPGDTRYFVDAAAGAPGDITFTLSNVTGASGGSARVRLTTPSSVVGTQSIATSPAATVAVVAQFPQKTTNAEYVVEVLDASGNVAEAFRGTVSVDVIAPAAPAFTKTFAAATDARVGNVLITIATPTYDDTLAASGAHAGYDIRWTTERQWTDTLGARAGAPCLELSSDYFDSAKAVAGPVAAWSMSSVLQPLSLPPANRYCIAVRAKDALGNYSAYVAPTVLNNDAREHELTNPTATAAQDFGLVLAAGGSLNNDALDDLVVGGSRRTITTANVGAVYVYFGGAGFGAQTTCTLPACQEITPYDTATSGRFGASLAVGDVGGPSASPDLVVGSPFFSTSTGRVMLYFGSSTQATIDTATYIEFRGAQTNTRLGEVVAVMPGRSGQTLLAISAHTEPFSGATATNQGRVYIYRSRTLAEWQAMRNASNVVIVNSATADWVIEGPLPVSTQSPSPSAGNQFARVRGGISTVGDMNGDSIPELAISMAKNTTDGNKVFIYAGREARDAGTSGSDMAATDGGAPLQMLSSSTIDPTEVGLLTGLGTRLVGGAIYGATAPDLLVTKQDLGQAFLYRDGAGGVFGAPDIMIQGIESLSFGAWASMGDFNGDSKMDIAVGDGANAGGSGWVFFQNGNNKFDANAANGFYQSRLLGAGSKGICTAAGDFDGDGVQDLAMGDSTTSPGKVFVWH